MADDSDSSLSEHSDKEIQKLAPIFLKAKKATKLVAPPPKASPKRPPRPPSPPHEEVLADNPDIAFLVIFRSRFADVLPSKLSHFGPQDIERGVVETTPGAQIEQLLRALLALVLNRKKPVEQGGYSRALEEAVLSNKEQWPLKWHGANPLHGGKSFENMTPAERLRLLRTLVVWSLSKSDVIKALLQEKYKQQRQQDDENQPLSVQPWGLDGDKRRYFLIQGQDDTSFRIYREGYPRHSKNTHWWSVASDIEEVKALAKKLEEVDGSQAARRFAGRITNAIPTFEATEEKRRRREYRQIRRAAFTRPEPGFSMYEGRTRGKRMRYTYDDDDDTFESDDTSTRRSTRQSNRSTPFDSGPTVTASGRQVRQPRTGDYGESLLSAPPLTTDDLGPENSEDVGPSSRARSGTEDSEQPVRGGRPTRSAARPATNGFSNQKKRKHIDSYNSIDEMSDEDEADVSDGGWNSDKNEADGDERIPYVDGEDDDMSEADEESNAEDDAPQSLLVRLRVPTAKLANIKSERASLGSGLKVEDKFAQAGAPTCEPLESAMNGHVPPTESYESSQKPQQPASSPIAPSAYPTPTSSSFLPVDQKLAVAPLPNFQAPMQRPIDYQIGGGSANLTDGSVSHTVLKMDDAAHDTEPRD